MRILLSLIILAFSVSAYAQIEFTDCSDAFVIQDPIDWCSENAQFNNIGVGASGYGPATCWGVNTDNDIWLEFTSFALAVNILIDVNGGNNDIVASQMALYSGNCGGVISELNCVAGPGALNMFETGLIIGQTYYIRINGLANQQGNFSICINNYNPPVEPGQDCVTGSVLCDKSPFVVQAFTGAGADPDEGAGTCLGPGGSLSENQSTWFKWTAANDGSLTFTITPLLVSDDLDFAVFEIPNTETCELELLRCMATSCAGPTGLNLTSTDLEEDWNCEAGEDGFVRFIDMVEGNSYALLINNFTSSGVGFGIEWGGTGEFLGPDPDFIIIPESGLACDQEFEIVNTSTSPPQINIISYDWNFGERAIPGTSNLENPPLITYEKFGEKFLTLTVETDKGCIVTEVLPLFAEPCCEYLQDIEIDLTELIDASCPGFNDGAFTVEGAGGSPEYEFDINSTGDFSETVSFDELVAGQYQVNIQDIKGCMDSIIVTINEPDPVIAEAGPDKETILGFGTELEGSFDPPGSNVTLSWSSVPVDSTMSCFDCPDPEIIPPGTTTYTLKVTTADGCMTFDDVTVRVKLERPVYEPNIFTPDEDGANDIFTVFTNRAGKNLDLLRIYDRWGNRVYEGINLELNNPTEGWDGMFNGQQAMQGVYAWYAEITFIDNVTVDFKGSVTLHR